MAKKQAGDVDDLLRRAHADASPREHRYVYGNSTGQGGGTGYVVRPNRKAAGRKVSTFYVIIVLLGFGVAIVVYINNIIMVNRLSAEIDRLQMQYNKISNSNAVLRAEINRKSGWERIGTIANERIGLRYPRTQATVFEIDEDLLEKVSNQPTSK